VGEKGQEAHKETDGSTTVRFWLSNCAVWLKNSDVLQRWSHRPDFLCETRDHAGTTGLVLVPRLVPHKWPMWSHKTARVVPGWDHENVPRGPRCRSLWDQDSAPWCVRRGTVSSCPRSPNGRPLVGRAGPDDAQDGDDEQDGEGHIGTDEGGGEGRSHDVEGRRGGMGQRSEEDGEGAGEGAEHEGGEAERPDAGAGLSVGYA